jgi:hypothetical protein
MAKVPTLKEEQTQALKQIAASIEESSASHVLREAMVAAPEVAHPSRATLQLLEEQGLISVEYKRVQKSEKHAPELTTKIKLTAAGRKELDAG